MPLVIKIACRLYLTRHSRRRVHSAGQELADGLMRHAEQDADVALGQALILQVPSGESRLRCGICAHPLSLLAGIPGSAHFFGQRGIEDGHDFHHPYPVHADVEVQRQQITHDGFRLIQAPGLGVGRITEVIAGDLKRPPALTAVRGHTEVPACHQRSSSAASAHIRSKVLKIPRAVYSTISLWRGTSTGRPPTKNLSWLPPCTG